MPVYAKKRYSKKKSYSKKGPSVKSIKKVVKKTIQMAAEKKFKDCYIQTNAGISSFTGATAFISVASATGVAGTGIVQGTGDGARLGDSIQIASLNLKAEMYDNDGLTNVPAGVRCVIMKDTAQFAAGAGVAPTVADVFESTANIWSPIKDVAYDRFQIIYDKILSCSNATAGTNSKVLKFYKKFPISAGNTIHFTGNTGNITDVGKNMFYIMFFTDNTNAKHTAYCRLRYTDV